jgi:hypothetical protein
MWLSKLITKIRNLFPSLKPPPQSKTTPAQVESAPDKVLFVSPDFTREKFEASENIDDFITKIKTK